MILHAESFCASHNLPPIVADFRLNDGTHFPMKALLASGMFDKPGAGGDDGAVLTTTADFAAVEGMLTSQELCVVATFLEEEIPEGAIVVVGEKDEGGADAEILRQREEQARALEKETEAKKAADVAKVRIVDFRLPIVIRPLMCFHFLFAWMHLGAKSKLTISHLLPKNMKTLPW